MPNFLHRTTKAYLPSTSETSLPEAKANYIEDPDLSAVTGFASKYWIITGDVVTLMDQTARDAVDAADAAALLAAKQAQAITRLDFDILTREHVESMLFEVNKVNTRVQELQDVLVNIKENTSTLAGLRNAIPDPSVTTNPAPTEFTRVNPKLRSQVLQDMADDINAGVADP